jgi:hypothetical protein
VTRGRLGAISVIVIAVAAATYLRDPPWLLQVTSGVGRWQAGSEGRFRWTGGRASFFVPARAPRIRLRLRSPHALEAPSVVRIDVDDWPAALVALRDTAWTEATVPLDEGMRARRRAVRVDLHVDRTWGALSRGVQLGEIVIE